MRVLSIKEPFASLILNKHKTIETRSWKTNYRGELFIHASGKNLEKKFLNNDYVNDLIKNMNMNYGYIICKCNLVDCVYMDDKFLETVKKNTKEYSCGEYKIGRYAWILKDVEPIKPILAKGKLNIWNYDSQYEILK